MATAVPVTFKRISTIGCFLCAAAGLVLALATAKTLLFFGVTIGLSFIGFWLLDMEWKECQKTKQKLRKKHIRNRLQGLKESSYYEEEKNDTS